jgi:purine nucleosidase
MARTAVAISTVFLLGIMTIMTTIAAEKQKIIFDCDLGGDIDDAFAVALVLTSPEFEVLGLVMDHGNTPKRAQIACRMLYETGMEHIPVVVGRHTPGIVGEDTLPAGDSQQFVWAEGFDKYKPIKQVAADFIIENLHKYPGEVILFTVGPVPNIQDVLQKDPQALKLAKRVVSMFGSFYMGYGTGSPPTPEWNVRADIKAAQKFVQAGANITFAGLDITTFVKLNEAYRTHIFQRQSPLTDALSGLYTLWRFEGYARSDPTLFDVVAVGMVLWPELFTVRSVHVVVDDQGFTRIDPDKPANGTIGVTIEMDELLKRVVERYIKQNLMRK